MIVPVKNENIHDLPRFNWNKQQLKSFALRSSRVFAYPKGQVWLCNRCVFRRNGVIGRKSKQKASICGKCHDEGGDLLMNKGNTDETSS
jgi:hypothetical protein